MRPAHRALLSLVLVLLTGQALAIVLYCFFFVPMFARGLGPDAQVTERQAELTTIVSLAAGALLTSFNVWVCARVLRTLLGGKSSAVPLLAVCVLDLLILARAAYRGWPDIAAVAAALLALLVACYRLDRRAFPASSPHYGRSA
ncbi:hypothetical protein IQ279_15280 [Streptomyces verrucosisporus]|uniref:hypothetical protein n=1 Tax=Streptomyces verrucosisporus TaxID=1695161 RepID=UPI0019D01747|nr:hypothetical protein [Streptomyces verrucosisporus]MBN3930976.1 hypothetical protein [Streptomyces verrucosisporus]